MISKAKRSFTEVPGGPKRCGYTAPHSRLTSSNSGTAGAMRERRRAGKTASKTEAEDENGKYAGAGRRPVLVDYRCAGQDAWSNSYRGSQSFARKT